jgi:hypothetical protein
MASIELIAKSNPRTNITLSINKQQTNRQRICDTEENQSIVFISIRTVLALIILVAPCSKYKAGNILFMHYTITNQFVFRI